jgi:transcriptional regulator GlxA family with amidase domain
MLDARAEQTIGFNFRLHVAVLTPDLAHQDFMGLRPSERRFQQETGASPKSFARVARFQAALDAKLASPGRTWLDIAHTFGYYDQMHMIRDFADLGSGAPTHLIAQMGDVRPPALASAA